MLLLLIRTPSNRISMPEMQVEGERKIDVQSAAFTVPIRFGVAYEDFGHLHYPSGEVLEAKAPSS